MANLMNPKKARDMDDQAATKVIAAIERLSNRIAKLDELSLETAAVATEARRAAMDAAEATNPKQIATYLDKAVSPKLDELQRDFGTLHREVKGGAWQAMHDAAEAKRLFEKNAAVYDRDLDAFQDEKLWWRMKAFIVAIIAAVAFNIGFELLV